MRINPYAIVLMLNFPLSLFLMTKSQKTKIEKYENIYLYEDEAYNMYDICELERRLEYHKKEAEKYSELINYDKNIFY